MKERSPEALPSMSLILTCYNQHDFIEEAVTSALKMEYEGAWELIIVDDASTDDSLQLIEKTIAATPHGISVKIVKLECNRGVSGAVDAGVAVADYDWLVMLDGDDIHCSDRLRNTSSLIAKYPNVGLIAMSARRIDEQGRDFGLLPYHLGTYKGETPPEFYLETSGERLKNLTPSNKYPTVSAYAGCSSVRKSLFLKWGSLVPESFNGERFPQDPVLQARCTLSAPVLGSLHVACLYRSHSHNILNRQRTWNFEGYLQHEIFMGRYSTFAAAGVQQILAAIERATKEPSLTDFSEQELQEYKDLTTTQLSAYCMRSRWWEISWFSRVWRIFRWYSSVPSQFRKWPFARLLPLRLFCYLKFYKKERWKK